MSKIGSRFEFIFSHIKLKQSLRYTFFLIFFVPFTIVYFVFVFLVYNKMRNWELKRAQTNLELTQKNFNEVLKNVSSLSDRIIINKKLQKVILKNYDDIQILYDEYHEILFLEDYLHGCKEISSFRIYSENQTLLENQFIKKVTGEIQNAPWYQMAMYSNGQIFWDYRQDPVTQKKFLCLIRSIWSFDGQFAGVLVINVNPQSIYQTLVDKNLMTFIVLDNKLVYSSATKAFEAYEQQLVKYIYMNDYSITKMTNMTIAEEKVGVVAVDFYPNSADGLKFQIINVIPINELIQTTRLVGIYSVIALLIIVLIMIFTLVVYSYYINRRVDKINREIQQIVDNDFEIAKTIGGNDEFEQIYHSIRGMSLNTKDLIKRLKINTEEKNSLALQQSEINFKMLSNQINPHFLFNTLETIRMKALAASDKEVATMLKLLASLLRYNLSVKGTPVPLLKELECVQNYLSIQHMRFGDRVSYDVVPLCDINEFQILPLLIQPIVENSFSHGLENRVSGGFIYISISSEFKNEKNYLTISVKDNGCGIDEEKLEEINKGLLNYKNQDSTKSIGLYNVQSRIKMFYGEDCGLTVESEAGEGTTVTIKIHGEVNGII